MTTFADSLKREIARVARKELRDELTALRKTSTAQRSEMVALKKQVKSMQSLLGRLAKKQTKPTSAVKPAAAPKQPTPAKGKPGRKVLFTADRLKAQRARLGFTQDQMARLLGVSSLSIWKWESGGAVPRAARVPQILQRIALGKREAMAIVDASPS